MAVSAGDQSILYVASHGMEDSYRATLIFAAAKAVAVKKVGIVRVALLGEATWLANKNIRNNFGLGPPTDLAGNEVRGQLSTLIDECAKAGVKIGV
jgi:predicted peroxiredoxin